ncbi:MAG: type II toxin-antitoxin system RelE/ParE family toxin [Neorhizobium sp.]|nr:type II toxin-antitoxin system RelE/ParE family toxin [Neorhizobium sp.]
MTSAGVAVIITPEARADLDRIWSYIAQHNRQRAITFVREIGRHCFSLPQFPRRHPLVPGHETSGIRRMPHGNDSVFYRVGEETIFILHILNAAQDHEAILFAQKEGGTDGDGTGIKPPFP